MSAAVNKVMDSTEWSLLLVLSLLWGGSFFLGKIALAGLPPFVVALGRVSLAAAALLVVVQASALRMPRTLRAWGALATMGALNNVIPFSLILWAQTQIGSGLAAILIGTTPLFSVVLAGTFLGDERLTYNRMAGALLGMAGVAVMIGADLLGGLGSNALAQLALLGAAGSYACAGIFGRRFSGAPPLVTAAGQLTCSSLMILPVVLFFDQPWSLPMPGASVWTALVAMALLSTAAAYVIYFRILATAGATNVLLVTFLMPVVALLLGTMFLDERLAFTQYAGMGLIALGLMAIDGRIQGVLRRA